MFDSLVDFCRSITNSSHAAIFHSVTGTFHPVPFTLIGSDINVSDTLHLEMLGTESGIDCVLCMFCSTLSVRFSSQSQGVREWYFDVINKISARSPQDRRMMFWILRLAPPELLSRVSFRMRISKVWWWTLEKDRERLSWLALPDKEASSLERSDLHSAG